ncbi:acyl-CoA dehydrogenase family protein, partial [Nocardiopsis sp. RV163]|uniref:acyl-CoA dehydrogenase family protein n=1 Tax=Nocardiopsis sp. RV163 TaxID=1661388 RepID=UPI00064BD88D
MRDTLEVGVEEGAGTPTRNRVLARATELARALVERQAETEERTFYAPDTHRAFSEADLYRILVPRRYGGLELGVETFLRVTMELARGCPSTGWMYCLSAGHALAAGTLFEESAQRELFATGEFLAPAVVAPGGSIEHADGGGWIVDGTWKYCSGAPYATHFIGHALVPPEPGDDPAPLMFVLPRDRWTRLDDWEGRPGLRGSGSHSVRVTLQRIPGRWTVPGHLSNAVGGASSPGFLIHGNPEYAGPQFSSMFLAFAALSVGMAKGALDSYEELMRTRPTAYPPLVPRSEHADYQRWYGAAAGMIAMAEAATLDAVRQWRRLCGGEGGERARERDVTIVAICREVIATSWRAVERYLYPTAGSSSTGPGERLERVWRD